MATNKTIVLITGGNSGIGFEAARQLAADGTKHVLLGSRSIEKGEKAVKDIQALELPGSVELLGLDVDSFESVQAAAKKVAEEHGKLHVLVNNAAIATQPKDIPLHEWMAACYKTNCIGPQIMVDAFGPLIIKASTPKNPSRIINVTSGAGSVERRLDSTSPRYKLSAVYYRSSKSALNMISTCQAVEYGEQGVKVFLYCPGFTVSNLGPHNNLESGAKPTSEGTAPLIAILNGQRDAEHGGYLHADGQYPW